eukprot:scaffold91522_cov61-Phaeocystis_antarctica.AAC.3
MCTGVSSGCGGAQVARTAQLSMEQVVGGGPVLVLHLALVGAGQAGRDRRDVEGLAGGGLVTDAARSGGARGAGGVELRKGGAEGGGGRGREARQRAEGQGAAVAHLEATVSRTGRGGAPVEAGGGGKCLGRHAAPTEVRRGDGDREVAGAQRAREARLAQGCLRQHLRPLAHHLVSVRQRLCAGVLRAPHEPRLLAVQLQDEDVAVVRVRRRGLRVARRKVEVGVRVTEAAPQPRAQLVGGRPDLVGVVDDDGGARGEGGVRRRVRVGLPEPLEDQQLRARRRACCVAEERVEVLEAQETTEGALRPSCLRRRGDRRRRERRLVVARQVEHLALPVIREEALRRDRRAR